MVSFPECTWPNKETTRAPIWYSVDLGDGNQALTEPMVVGGEVEMFNLLVKLGFKETEVGSSAASQAEYGFLRTLMEYRLIPSDVKVQMLMRCRERLTKRTFRALEGAEKVIAHIYNFVPALQRGVVFHKDREDTKDIAVIGTKIVQWYMADCDIQTRLKYSPESFTGTGLDFALNVCTTVQETQGATKEKPIIINLSSTVEMTTPNVHANQIEWISVYSKDRGNIIPSVHSYNDRGRGVASTELALLAGTGRVEGILFGNGERADNVDVLTIAYNMFLQDINPEFNIKNTREIVEVYEHCTKMDVPPRHPYADKLVFTAFFGPRQDIINRDMQAFHERNGQYWEVPHPPIDPGDIGREYKPIVRVSSQSGEGGITFIMDTLYGFKLPGGIHREFADVIRKISKQQGKVAPEQIVDEFKEDYLEHKEPIHFGKYRITDTGTRDGEFATLTEVTYSGHGTEKTFEGTGNGPIGAVQRGMEDALGAQIKALDYSEHTLAPGSGIEAAPYIHLVDQVAGRATCSVDISSNITRASVRGIFSTADRLSYQ